MPVHDWTRVEDGIFHAFHVGWIGVIQTSLNGGLLPKGFYALAEQHAGRSIPDILTLHASPAPERPSEPLPFSGTGGTAVADAPPKVRRKQRIPASAAGRRRTLAIRHVSGHRLVALVEIVSPANKDRPQSVASFVEKALSALDAGVHLMLVDLFPPGPNDPHGMDGAILQQLEEPEEPNAVPADEPLTLASYSSGVDIDIYTEHVAVGAVLPAMPLFLSSERYIDVPLDATYQEAYRGMPEFWRDVLEGRA
jgi:hypothetical protein